MTSISVNDVAKSLQNLQKAKSPFDSRMTGKSFQDDNSFQNAIDLYKKPMDVELSKKVQSLVTNSVEESQKYAKNGTAKDCVKESGMNTVKKERTFSEDEMDAVEQAAEKIVSQIAEELNVSEEEVKQALETLGITVFDLGNANQMAALFTEVLGISDGMQIVTDGDLFASLTSLTQGVNELIQSLQEEMQVSVEELLVQLQEQMSESNETDVNPNVVVTDLGMEAETSALDEVVQSTLPVEVMDSGEEGSVEVLDANENQFDKTVGGRDALSTEMTQNSSTSNLENRDSENPEGKQNLNQNTFSVFMDGNQTVAVEGVDTQNVSYSRFNDIMEQIGDYVRTNVTADVKQMEIQLSPANLGQVHINMVSKNGVVTAQITTENEMVKSAIELQVVQLKERLENQGVKIEAVEVTVASHEFERNLDQNNENRESKEEVKKVSSRKWNLSELDGDLLGEEELTDSEQVELDMMKITGNQLNYMV